MFFFFFFFFLKIFFFCKTLLCFHEIQRVRGTPSEDQRINCSVHGRYVIYYNERLPNVTYPSYYSSFAHYDLCELEVYGK